MSDQLRLRARSLAKLLNTDFLAFDKERGEIRAFSASPESWQRLHFLAALVLEHTSVEDELNGESEGVD